MGMFCAVGGVDVELGPGQLRELLTESLGKLGRRERVLAVPPDITRLHSQAGVLTCAARELLGDRLKAVLPAIGTHAAMTPAQKDHMYPGVPHELFRVHNWRTDVETLGEVPAEFIYQQSEGKLNVPWPAQTNRLISQGGFDLILSIGQVVPHEVIGMANYNKNILIGAGGRQSINLSHYLGAVYGMERIMGRAENPVRAVLNYASDRFLRELPIVYVQTVVGRRADGGLAVRGLFIGAGPQSEQLAACEGCVQLPFMPHRELPPYYRAAEIGVWPTQESMSMLDAAACGLPIIVNDTLLATERIDGNGITYRLNDAADLAQRISLLHDPAYRQQLGSTGARRMVELFSWAAIARRRIAEYEAVLASRRQAA